MKKGLIFLGLLMLIGCKETAETESEGTQELTEENSVEQEEIKDVHRFTDAYGKEVKEVMTLLLPAYYDDDSTDTYSAINENWLEFRKVDKTHFIVKQADYNLTDPILNECTEVNQIGVFSPEEEEPLFFCAPNKLLTKGDIVSLPIKKKPLWPGEVYEYKYKGHTYALEAEGTVKNTYMYTDDTDPKGKEFREIEDYKLYISVDGAQQQMVLNIPIFSDTFVELLFVGDLDGDGKLDFVFDTSADYEQKEIQVYLSKEAKHYLYLAGSGGYDFSC